MDFVNRLAYTDVLILLSFSFDQAKLDPMML